VVTEIKRQRQHLVSRGYQKNFATPDDRVAVLDAESGEVLDRNRPVTSNWREEDLLTVVDAAGNQDRSLEDEFKKTEGKVLDQIRRITPNKITPEQRQALDLVAAIHLVRSLSFVKMHRQVTDAFFDNCIADFVADPQVLDAFVSDRGRQPAAGELEFLVAAQTRKFQESPDLRANGMRHVNAGIPGLLGRYQVQLVEAPRWMGFVLADQPVLHARPDEGRYGFASELAVGDADLIIVPIQRRLVAFYTVQPSVNLHMKLGTERGLKVITAALCRNAVKEVACHPDDAPDVSKVIRYIDKYPVSALTGGTMK
jgi:Protein of unknown function (DUF4238)